jgi:hypothetical protein
MSRALQMLDSVSQLETPNMLHSIKQIESRTAVLILKAFN